jgi:2-methylcitrate dehydratase PrpD
MDALVALAKLVADARWSGLPEHVRARTRVRLLDAIGCSLSSRDSEVTRKALELARSTASAGGPASYWLSDLSGAADACAFANGILAHSILHEDVGQGGHPGSTVVPAAIAVAESRGCSGAQLLAAIAVGYEVQVRMGAGDLLHAVGDRGLRGTVATGAFGAAAAAASLLRLPPEAAGSALAFAASLCAPGLEQPLLVGSNERCLQVGANARSGVLCAELAAAGFRGAASALSGEAGFFAVYAGLATEPSDCARDLGAVWLSDGVVSKPYPTAGWNVGPVYATLELIGAHGLRAEEVAAVHVMHTWWHRNTGYLRQGPFETMEQALVSCPFAVACALVHGRMDWQTVQQALGDPRVTELAQRITIDGVATWGFTDGEVTVVTTDGRRLHATAAEIPDRLVRPTWPDAVAKLHAMMEPLGLSERAADLVTAIEPIDEADGIGALTALLGAGPAAVTPRGLHRRPPGSRRR